MYNVYLIGNTFLHNNCSLYLIYVQTQIIIFYVQMHRFYYFKTGHLGVGISRTKNFIGFVIASLVIIIKMFHFNLNTCPRITWICAVDAVPWHKGGNIWEEIVRVIVLRVVLVKLTRLLGKGSPQSLHVLQ